MLCLVLAAGYATRLYPLTENYPKPLLTVQGKAILDWLLDDINTSGVVSEYVIISNHKYVCHFEEWAKAKPYKITVVDDGTETNETRLGAVRDIQFAVKKLNIDDDCLVIAGDNLLDFSLFHFINYIKKKRTSCVMRYYESSFDILKKSGVLTIDDDDLIKNMTEKSPTPASHWCCPPFYYYTQDDLKLIDEAVRSGCGTDAPGSFVAWLCKRSRVFAMEMPGKRYDIGDIGSYEQVQKEYRGVII
ncbi:MAG: nucleotidyltransferase family protein [Clostridiales bacterium]|jgi:glucose-1-phosphate thymidylyltransferase|nr:nucleotidyltransferase family protein [Clostridiales bacterium]